MLFHPVSKGAAPGLSLICMIALFNAVPHQLCKLVSVISHHSCSLFRESRHC